MSFWEHLEELRWRIFKSLLGVIAGGIIIYFYSDDLIKLLVQPTENLSIDLNLQVLKVTSMFMIKLGISIMGGICLGLPILVYQSWCYIEPAFEKSHRLGAVLMVSFSSIFFFFGLTFGYYVMLPFSLNFFTSMTTQLVPVNYNFTLDNYLHYAIWLLFSGGLVFQLPVVTLFFTRIGFLTPPFLRHYRKWAFVTFLIMGAILTPPDPLSQILILFPLVLLYEFSIFISWIFMDRKTG